jgi:hypothetical protein
MVENWEEIFDHTTGYAARTLLKRGELPQQFFLHCPEGTSIIVAPWSDSKGRDLVLFLIAAAALAWGAEGITAISEAWRSSQRADQPRVQPKDDPNRTEVLIVVHTHYDDDGEKVLYSIIREILRDDAGKIIGLADEADPGNAEGILTDLLPPPGAPADVREKAAVVLKSMGIKRQYIHPAGHA